MSNLATPTVSVNDDIIEIKPNSLKYKVGKGDFTLRTQQAGSAATVVASKNAETQKGMIGFTMITTAANHERLQAWLDARENGGCTVDFFDGSINGAGRNMIIATEPDTTTGSEGEIEVEFEGPPLSV